MAEPIVTSLGTSTLDNTTVSTLLPTDGANVGSFEVAGVFDPTTDIIQAYLYDFNNTFISRLTTSYNVTETDPTSGITSISIDPGRDLTVNGYTQGRYNTQYNFIAPLIKSNPNLFISEISLDRTELKVNSSNLVEIQLRAIYEQLQTGLTSSTSFAGLYLDFGSNQIQLAVNVGFEDGTLLLKLYQPLPTTFGRSSNFNLVEKVSDSNTFSVIYPAEEVQMPKGKTLRGPNFNLKTSTQTNTTTEYQTYTSLTTASAAGMTNRLQSVLAENRAELNTDYKDYENFIFFSSAETRLTNFNYKATLLESYTSAINTLDGLTNTPATELSSSKAFYENEIDSITRNFDGYDYHLYYESGSTAWPKQNASPPYIPYSYSSSVATNWLTEQSGIAILYDNNNRNNLYNIFPTYIIDDESNAQFKLFTELTAQMFDEIWLYTDALKNRQDADNSLSGGISTDLVADALKSYGIDLYESSFTNGDLFTSLLGITEAGGTLPSTGSEVINTYVTSSAETIPFNDAQKLIYKRLYHNLPYLLKKKGTTSGLRVLLNCFGIPDTVLRISEFGGKDKNTNTWDYWYNEFNYSFNTSGSGYISTPWEGGAFVSTWGAASPIELPLVSGSVYNMTVDWGDGTPIDTITAWDDVLKTHTYAVSGYYDITIRGTIGGFAFNNTGYKSSITDIKEFGPLELSTSASFYGTNLLGLTSANYNLTAIDDPAISTTTLKDTFRGASIVKGNFSNWRIQNVTSLENTFRDAEDFDSPLTDWDVSNVTTLKSTFEGAAAFNQPLNWDTSGVTTFNSMFKSASAFNSPLGFDTVSGTNFAYMFNDAIAFNQDIGSFNMENATDISYMLKGATSFDLPLLNWNINSFQTTSNTFAGTRLFNQNLGGWDMTAVSNTSNMFAEAVSYNNQGTDLNTWDLLGVTNASGMFYSASAFNQSLAWNTLTSLQNADEMFYNAAAFNQDISSMPIQNLQTAWKMLDGTSFSQTNYDTLLVTWAALSPIPPNISFSAADTNYTIATSQIARNVLTGGPNNWYIVDKGGL